MFWVMWVVYIISDASLCLALLTDDAVRRFLKLPEPDYYALLIAIAVTIACLWTNKARLKQEI
ncbi:hypothetical protein [Nostoc sp.]|uniref:hypothetical protein n=1 Tax=Nostoc sp. TaxID=1180 RepID=UPI002FF4CCA2